MSEKIVYFDEGCYEFYLRHPESRLDITVIDSSPDSVAIEHSGEPITQSDNQFMLNDSEDNTLTHFRSYLRPGECVSFSVKKDTNPNEELRGKIYFLEGAAISCHCQPEIHIERKKEKKFTKTKYFFPHAISASLEYINTAEPQTTGEVTYILDEIISCKEKIKALLRERITDSLKEESEIQIKHLSGMTRKLRAMKKRLSTEPTFEAEKNKILIREMAKLIKEKGFEMELDRINKLALKEASKLCSASMNDSPDLIMQMLCEHKLHSRFELFFENGPPPPLPIPNCAKCNAKAILVIDKNPSTNKKRYHIKCVKCSSTVKNPYQGRASSAIYNWIKNCTSASSLSFSDINALQFDDKVDGDFDNYQELLSEYLNLYEKYLNACKRYYDETKREFISSRQGKISFMMSPAM